MVVGWLECIPVKWYKNKLALFGSSSSIEERETAISDRRRHLASNRCRSLEPLLQIVKRIADNRTGNRDGMWLSDGDAGTTAMNLT